MYPEDKANTGIKTEIWESGVVHSKVFQLHEVYGSSTEDF